MPPVAVSSHAIAKKDAATVCIDVTGVYIIQEVHKAASIRCLAEFCPDGKAPSGIRYADGTRSETANISG